MSKPLPVGLLFTALLALLLLLPSQIMAAVAFDDVSPWDNRPEGPDAVVGGWYFNLGITGARAKLLRSNLKSLTIMYVFPNTPAAGKLQVGDRIIGVNNRPFMTPAAFEYGDKSNAGPLMDFGNALEESQNTLNGLLTLTVVRGTAQSNIVLNIGTRYGAFNGGFPSSNCPKMDLILSELYPYLDRTYGEWIGATETNWIAALALLASGDPQYLPTVKRAAQKIAQDTHRNVTSDDLDGLSVWHNTFAGIFLSEYYLATRESWVLSELEEIRDWLMATQFMNAATQVRNKFPEYGPVELNNSLGGWGHNPGFEGYGPMSITTAQAAMALSLMRECGITVDRSRLDKALDYCAIATSPTGFVGYEAAWGQNNGNDGTDKGRDGAVGLANYLCTYTDAKYQQRAQLISTQVGTNINYFPDTHASPAIGMIWHAAAAQVRPEGFSNLMNNYKWWFNLAHNTDGTFGYQPNRDNTINSGNFRLIMSPVIALVFSLHKKNLRISGAQRTTNTAPTISNIADRTTTIGVAVSNIPFTVGDLETAVGSLTLNGSSSNTTLVPNANIVFGGSGVNRTVTVTPAAGQTGTATITVRVSDGSLTATDTFVLTVSSTPNTAPTISNIANTSTNEDTATAAIALTVGDTQTAATALTVTGSSSNTTLVPNSNIVFGGSGANRTLTLTPAANQIGTSTITITVSDGALTATDTFVLTVNALNDAPTISNIANQTTMIGVAVSNIAFTVGDLETAVGSLTLSGSSSNTTLVSNANIVFGGSGANRTVTVTPASGQTGTATITVTVSDGSLTATDTFVLTVSATPNTAPTISNIANTSTNEDTATSAIAFTVGDAQTAAASLTLSGSSSNTTLVPNANIVFGGSGANRTVAITPAANRNGTATITVTVSDGALAATDTFVLTVNAVNDTPTISNIANQTTAIGVAVGNIAITVGDLETAVGSLTLSGSSSNTTLVPSANIVFGGSGANRTVTVTPAAGQTGTATITVRVSDGSLTATDTFVLTVSSTPNTAPTISNIANTSTNEDTATAAIAFTVGDAQTAATVLTVSGSSSNTTLVPNANIVFGGSGANRTVAVTPAAGQTGTATITVTVNDGGLTATDTFVLTVNAVNRTLSLTSEPFATPNPANAGSVVQFTVVASGNDPLSYQWDFGDGSNAVGATVLNSYAAPGSYSVTVTVSDASGQSVTGSLQMIVVSGANPGDDTDGDGVPNGLDNDDDNDGVSDDNEIADGTDPLNPISATKVPFEMLKMSGSAKFNATGKDSCSISGMLPAQSAGFNPLGVTVKLDVGGATHSFTLDAKGRAKTTDGSFGLKLKLVTNKTTKKKEFLGGSVPFKAKISKGSWTDEWIDEGVDPTTSAAKKPMPIVVDITVGGRIYTHTAIVNYSSKAKVGGKFKK